MSETRNADEGAETIAQLEQERFSAIVNRDFEAFRAIAHPELITRTRTAIRTRLSPTSRNAERVSTSITGSITRSPRLSLTATLRWCSAR